mmetsp:Transcript_76117/g.246518  ORF Transcript_76117/g.246518 Transcript_76117/m.246518 type:complete len:313 (+) Transcript_76117:1-939(+)
MAQALEVSRVLPYLTSAPCFHSLRAMAGSRTLAALAAAAAARGAAAADAISLVQHSLQYDPPELTAYTEGMRIWLGGFYSIMRTRTDPLLSGCCSMALQHRVLPWESWGTADAEQQVWWNERECNAVVGAYEENIPVGTPNCQTATALSSLVPAAPPLTFELAATGAGRSGAGCSLEDRKQLNNTFLGLTTEEEVLGEECMPYHVAVNGMNYTTLRRCVQKLMGVSTGCSACYADMLQDIAGDNTPTTPACFVPCMPLMACEALKYCNGPSTTCAACVQPAITTHAKCLGGPVENQMDMEGLLAKMVGIKVR